MGRTYSAPLLRAFTNAFCRTSGGGRLAYQPTDKPALWCRFTLQSCLCPTPELRSFHMGIALTTFSALSSPVRTLTRWLQSTPPLQEPACSDPEQNEGRPEGTSHRPSEVSVPSPPRPALPPGFGISRPVRGNWPFTVNPPPSATEREPRAGSKKAAETAPAAVGRGGLHTGRPWSRVGCGAPKGERGIRFHRDSGRVVIAGRMADVCAELDRMVASEARLQAH